MGRKRNRPRNLGQAATEYMLIVAVVVLGLVAAASRFVPEFKTAINGLATYVSGVLKTPQEFSKPE